MLMLPMRSFRWSIENARALGVAGAFVSVVYVRADADQPSDIFGVLSIVLPALEVAMFAMLFAISRDGLAKGSSRFTRLCAMTGWFAICFAFMWLNVAFVRAGMDAYVRLGAPPMLVFTL